MSWSSPTSVGPALAMLLLLLSRPASCQLRVLVVAEKDQPEASEAVTQGIAQAQVRTDARVVVPLYA